jgi:hypothetical protein
MKWRCTNTQYEVSRPARTYIQAADNLQYTVIKIIKRGNARGDRKRDARKVEEWHRVRRAHIGRADR